MCTACIFELIGAAGRAVGGGAKSCFLRERVMVRMENIQFQNVVTCWFIHATRSTFICIQCSSGDAYCSSSTRARHFAYYGDWIKCTCIYVVLCVCASVCVCMLNGSNCVSVWIFGKQWWGEYCGGKKQVPKRLLMRWFSADGKCSSSGTETFWVVCDVECAEKLVVVHRRPCHSFPERCAKLRAHRKTYLVRMTETQWYFAPGPFAECVPSAGPTLLGRKHSRCFSARPSPPHPGIYS